MVLGEGSCIIVRSLCTSTFDRMSGKEGGEPLRFGFVQRNSIERRRRKERLETLEWKRARQVNRRPRTLHSFPWLESVCDVDQSSSRTAVDRYG